jgi:hypothetical protein
MLKLKYLLVPVILIIATACDSGKMTLSERLSTLPAEEVVKIEADSMFSEAYELSIIQPVDHNNPDGPKFNQQVFLDYVGPDAPVVVVTEGYGARNYKSELAGLLKCNQIIIEHRYFEESTPDSINWKYLTTWQAATDQHVIIELFKPVFRGKWLTTGISKGGQTVMYHSFYYPEDVDVRVPYVGPLNFGPEDSRMADFLAKDGTPECRQRIFDFQKLVLEKENVLIPMLKKLAADRNWTFTRVGSPEIAFEMGVMEYEFAFWQWGGIPCDSIPLDGTDSRLFNHLSGVADFRYFADQGLAYFEPFFYQAMTEIGYYGYQFEKFKGLLKFAGENGKPEFLFSAPQGTEMVYNYAFAKDVDTYIKTKAKHFIFIYGEYDPWSASAVDLAGNPDCIKVVREKGSHGSRIGNLSPEQRELVYSKLEEWLGVKIKRTEN